MKQWIVRIVSIALLVVMCLSLVACDRSGIDDDLQKINTNKTQLYVKYCNGGFGRTWLDILCTEFEEMYKDVSFETGKKGVQIMKDFDKRNVEVGNMSGNINQVFLQEDRDYYDFIAKDTLLDITDVVTGYAVTGVDADGNATKETKRTIDGKMSDTYKSFYNVGSEQSPKYYGLPLYETSINIVYNKDLFDSKCFYFAKGATAENFSEEDFTDDEKIQDLFVLTTEAERSYGPDNKPNTYDDGLPATYADFRALLIYMRTNGTTPFVWNGYETGYLTGMVNDMWANNVGAEQMMLNFTFSGTAAANTLVEVDSNGKIVHNADGSVKLNGAATEINANNYSLLQLQKGKLDALKFAKLILDDSKNYYSKSFDSGFTHTNAQDCFVKPSSYQLSSVGFLIEGGWWYKEMDQRQAFTTEQERMSKQFAVLPLPKADATQLGQPITKVSDRKSVIFANKYMPSEVLPIAKAFIAFLQSDHALETYTRYTDAFRAMEYDISDETKSALTPFGRSVYELRSSDDTVTLPWLPLSETARKNVSSLNYRNYGFATSSTEGNPFIYIKDNPTTTYEQYFEYIFNYKKK